jgi:transposase InsO family protein
MISTADLVPVLNAVLTSGVKITEPTHPRKAVVPGRIRYIAHSTREFAIAVGLEPRTTPIKSPESNGMAEAFVRTFKRDYVRVNAIPNAQSLMNLLPAWFDHCNTIHPHKALRYRSLAEFIRATLAT